MLQLAVFLALAFSIVIAVFAVQNTTQVDISFLFFQARAPVSILVLVSAALGAGVMLLLGTAREVRIGLRTRRLGRQLRAAETRIQQLEANAATPVTVVPDAELVPALPASEPAEITPRPRQPDPDIR